MRPVFRLLAITATALACSSTALAQAWPDRPIKAVVPFAAGSATDTIGRAFALKMQESLGQTIVVDNKPGAAGLIGAGDLLKSPRDGSTFMVQLNAIASEIPHAVKVPFDPMKVLRPIAELSRFGLVMAATLAPTPGWQLLAA